MKRLINILLTLAIATSLTMAQEPTDSINQVIPTIADKINESGKSSIIQPDKLNQRLIKKFGQENSLMNGYRIQAYSGNNAQSAQQSANYRAAQIAATFPNIGTYVTYDAPYWRLRVGNFVNYDEAADCLSELKKAFPKFARELRLVRDKIIVVE